MKLIWKILIFVGALWFIGSAMTAAPTDMNNLKMPDGWEHAIADGNYADPLTGGHLLVFEVDNETIDEYTTNDTEMKWYVTDCSGNGTMYTYEDNWTGVTGYFEFVSVDGTVYVLDHSYSINEDLLGAKILNEFNELNNLEPIAV